MTPTHANMSTTATQPNRCLNLLALPLLGIAFAMRLYRLGTPELWYDEAATYVNAMRGLLENLEYARINPGEHPPAYFLLEYVWMQAAGMTEFAMRFLSLWLGVFFVALIYRFVRREVGIRAALCAAFAAAISQFLIVYSQEVRMYALLLVLAVLAYEYFLAVVRHGHLHETMLLMATAVVGMAVHYLFALTFIGEFVFIVLHGRSLNRRGILLWVAMALLLAVPVVAWILISPGLRAVLMATALGGSWAPAWNFRLEQIVADMGWVQPFGVDFRISVRLLGIGAWLPVGFGILYNAGGSGKLVELRRFLASMVVGTLITIGFLNQGVVGRHVAVMYPAFLLLLVFGLVELYRRRRLLGVAGTVSMLVLSGIGVYDQYVTDRGDWGQQFRQIAKTVGERDVIVSAQPNIWPVLAYYSRDLNTPIRYFPRQPTRTVVDPVLDPEPEELAQFVATLAQQYARVWVGPTGPGTNDPGSTMPRWLAEHGFAARADYGRSASLTLFYPGDTSGAAMPVGVMFGDSIRLHTAQVQTEPAMPGDAVRVILTWQATRRIVVDDLPFLTLVDQQNRTWSEQRMLPCAGLCLTSDWKVDQSIEDRHAVLVPLDTPPGVYFLRLQVFHPPAHGFLAMTKSGLPDSDRFELARIQIASKAESK